MGFRLLILSWWTPECVIRRELENISDRTIGALTELVYKYAAKVEIASQKKQQSLSIQEQRAIMAQTHTRLVETLVAMVGQEEAVILGREALFSVGLDVGELTRNKLGVGDNPKDLTKAAKILYRILGIEFHLEWLDNSNATAIIDRCALAEQYSKLTCEVLSAADEGVISGLQPNVTMKFKEYMTSGCQNCRACIHFHEKEIMK